MKAEDNTYQLLPEITKSLEKFNDIYPKADLAEINKVDPIPVNRIKK